MSDPTRGGFTGRWTGSDTACSYYDRTPLTVPLIAYLFCEEFGLRSSRDTTRSVLS